MTPKLSDLPLGEENPSVALSDLTEDIPAESASIASSEDDDSYEEDEEEVESLVSREEAFARLWTDSSFHDMTLEGSDGLQVPVNSYALAARNKTFRSLLSKTEGSVIKMEYPGEVLKTIVKYIHTDKAEIQESIGRQESGNDYYIEGVTAKEALQNFQSLLLLLKATRHFKLSVVEEITQECLLKHINACPALSFATLEECQKEEHVVPPEMEDLAMFNIQSGNIDLSNSTLALGLVSQKALQTILTANKITMDNQQIFALLHAWAYTSIDGCLHDNNIASRTDIAADMIKNSVDLSCIDPVYLSSTVASSGLVTPDRLGQAYQKQALAAKQKAEDSYALQQQLQKELSEAKEDLAENKQALREAEEAQSKNKQALHEAEVAQVALRDLLEQTKKSLTNTQGELLQTKASLTSTEEELVKTKASLTSKEKKVSFYKHAHLALWNSSGSKELRLISCSWKTDTLKGFPKMTSGSAYRWTIRIESLHNVMLGIAKNQATLNLNAHIGGQRSNGWGYQCIGYTYHNGTTVRGDLPRYSAGSQVTLELNLLPDREKSGTLSASVDGGEYFLLFGGLLHRLGEDGFAPAASLLGENKIRLTSFEML